MPTYSYRCKYGHEFDVTKPMRLSDEPEACFCGEAGAKVPAPFHAIGPRDVHYLSPIDGRPITSERMRRDDMARNNCMEYDPGVRQDYDRRIRKGEQALDSAVDATVEKEMASMPSAKREKLAAELSGGIAADISRATAPAKPIETRLKHG